MTLTNKARCAALALLLTGCHKSASPSASVDTPVTPVSTEVKEDTTITPAAAWQEHWDVHTQLLTRKYYSKNLAVYFDKDVKATITWPFTYLDSAWQYTKKNYGLFGKDPHLYAIFHAGKYSGGHPSTVFDESHDYRNVIDCGSDDMNAWITGIDNDIDLTTHEIGHIVEGSSRATHNSPAFPLWQDSKWMEIYQYDVYLGLGRNSDAQRWAAMMTADSHHDDFPQANTHWFRDWWLPVYNQYGGTKVLSNFFLLLSKNFPSKTLADGTKEYTRDMNWGELIHFWSGAAGANLKAQATKAFGWPDTWEIQFKRAQADFPGITYSNQ